jgi:hypothetical protein
MSIGSVMGACVRAILLAFVLLAPALHPNGQLWVIAVASTAVVYWGIRGPVVYTLLLLLVATEVLYGGDVGSVSGAFAVTVGVLVLLRRVITIQSWASQEGWRVGDMLRTVVVAWVFTLCVVALSILVGDVLFGYDRLWVRILSLWSVRIMGTSFVVCTVASVMLRRMTVPFRRAILFGI